MRHAILDPGNDIVILVYDHHAASNLLKSAIEDPAFLDSQYFDIVHGMRDPFLISLDTAQSA